LEIIVVLSRIGFLQQHIVKKWFFTTVNILFLSFRTRREIS